MHVKCAAGSQRPLPRRCCGARPDKTPETLNHMRNESGGHGRMLMTSPRRCCGACSGPSYNLRPQKTDGACGTSLLCAPASASPCPAANACTPCLAQPTSHCAMCLCLSACSGFRAPFVAGGPDPRHVGATTSELSRRHVHVAGAHTSPAWTSACTSTSKSRPPR